jgi:hypothetical protein
LAELHWLNGTMPAPAREYSNVPFSSRQTGIEAIVPFLIFSGRPL